MEIDRKINTTLKIKKVINNFVEVTGNSNLVEMFGIETNKNS